MVPLPTYQASITPNFSDYIDVVQATDEPETPFAVEVAALPTVIGLEADTNDMSLVPVSPRAPSPTQEPNVLTANTQITLISCPVSSPRNMMNDISENPSWSPLSCPAHVSRLSITVTLNVRFTLVSPQECVLPLFYRHERPIAIVRPVLMLMVKSMDNSQGKCARYKVKLRPIAHWSNDMNALSRVMNNPVRRRIAVAPDDNSEGKPSRFKGLAIVRVQTSSLQIIVYSALPFPTLQSLPP